MRARPTLGAFLALTVALTAITTSVPAHAGALSHQWPAGLQIGLKSDNGQARAQRAQAPFGFRYVYLTGGVGTGRAWSSHGLSSYLHESFAAGVVPDLVYFQINPSGPPSGDPGAHDIGNLANRALMRGYWRDVRRVFRTAGRFRGHLVTLQIEPDLWEYAEQDRGTATSVAVSSTGDRALRGLPNDLSGFAKAFARLRDRLAPNVALGWHLSVWGMGQVASPTVSDMRRMAARRAAAYLALHVPFDFVSTDVADDDTGQSDPAVAGWDETEFELHLALVGAFTRRTHAKVMVWQIPVGNTSLPNTPGRYRDNRVQWFLGTDSAAAAHRRDERNAGVVALLFGPGVASATSPTTDGGLFYRLAARFYAGADPAR